MKEKNEFSFLRQCVCLNIHNTIVFKIAALWGGGSMRQRGKLGTVSGTSIVSQT